MKTNKPLLALLILTGFFSFNLAPAMSEARVTGEIEYDVPEGDPDLECSDAFGSYYVYNLKQPEKIQILEPRGEARVVFPHKSSNVQVAANSVTFDSTLNTLVFVEKYRMTLDLSRQELTVFSHKSQKTYVLSCKAVVPAN